MADKIAKEVQLTNLSFKKLLKLIPPSGIRFLLVLSLSKLNFNMFKKDFLFL